MFILITALFLYKIHDRSLSSHVCFSSRPSWLDRPDEEVIEKFETGGYPDGVESLFDSVYNSKSSIDDRALSISQFTLREISESYGFSLDYLGDYVTQLGNEPPIDIDSRLGDLLNGEQIYTLLEAITSLDPFDSNISYDTVSLADLAEELDSTVEDIIKTCAKESFNLPFGTETYLHNSVVSRIRDIYSFDRNDEIDYTNAIDVEGDDVISPLPNPTFPEPR